MSFPESATEPKNLDQLCLLQEGLLQRCQEFLDACQIMHYLPGRAPEDLIRLLDDLRAHVDPDAPPPVDGRLLTLANAHLMDVIKGYADSWEACNKGLVTPESLRAKWQAHDELLRLAGVEVG
jgi:hypothetical protein